MTFDIPLESADFSFQAHEATGRCGRCETWPSSLAGPGTLHAWFPFSHTLGTVKASLAGRGLKVEQAGQMLTVTVPDTDLIPLAQSLSDALSSQELQDIRSIFQQEGQAFHPADFLASYSLGEFVGRTQVDWLLNMVRTDGLTSAFQPIVDCSSGAIFGYECLLRGTSGGAPVSPGRILAVARQAGLLFQIDLAGRRSAIVNAARHGIAGHLFINFTPTAIYSPQNCLRRTVALIEECGLQPDKVVFEVIESDKVEDVRHLVEILDFYRERGFRVALDDLGAGYSSLNLLAGLRPDFVKLDRDLITDVHQDEYRGTIAAKLLETAAGIGVKTIGEGVEKEEEFHWLNSHGVDYAQGYLLARPATPPPPLAWTPAAAGG